MFADNWLSKQQPFRASPPSRGASRREQGEARARNEPRETQRPGWRAGGWGTGARGGGAVSAASARKISDDPSD